MRLRPSASPTEVVVLPSPAGVGVIAVTSDVAEIDLRLRVSIRQQCVRRNAVSAIGFCVASRADVALGQRRSSTIDYRDRSSPSCVHTAAMRPAECSAGLRCPLSASVSLPGQSRCRSWPTSHPPQLIVDACGCARIGSNSIPRQSCSRESIPNTWDTRALEPHRADRVAGNRVARLPATLRQSRRGYGRAPVDPATGPGKPVSNIENTGYNADLDELSFQNGKCASRPMVWITARGASPRSGCGHDHRSGTVSSVQFEDTRDGTTDQRRARSRARTRRGRSVALHPDRRAFQKSASRSPAATRRHRPYGPDAGHHLSAGRDGRRRCRPGTSPYRRVRLRVDAGLSRPACLRPGAAAVRPSASVPAHAKKFRWTPSRVVPAISPNDGS